MTRVASRIVNDFSYVMRINHEIHFAWQAQYLVKLEDDSCFINDLGGGQNGPRKTDIYKSSKNIVNTRGWIGVHPNHTHIKLN